MTTFYTEYNSPERRVEFEHVTGIPAEDNVVAFICYLNMRIAAGLADKVEALSQEVQRLQER